jgi:20S proteasome alpha/beta subunit
VAGTRFKHPSFSETTAASFQLSDRIRTATPGCSALIEHLVRRLQFHALNFEKLHRVKLLAASFQLSDRIRTATPGGIALIEHLVRRLQFHALNFEKLHRVKLMAASFQLGDRICTAAPGDITLIELCEDHVLLFVCA